MRTIWLSLLLSTALAVSVGQAVAGETRARQILDRFEHANQWRDHVLVAAHRAGGMQAGKTLYPENSIAAVEASIAMGAEIVEVDIRRSKDGQLVVMHDSWLDRTTTCKGEVVKHTLAELKTCRLVNPVVRIQKFFMNLKKSNTIRSSENSVTPTATAVVLWKSATTSSWLTVRLPRVSSSR